MLSRMKLQRTALILLLLVVQWLYFPINSHVSGGAYLDIWLDRFIPVWPVWVVPYTIWLVWWIGCFLWTGWYMPTALFKRFFATTLLTIAIGISIFFFFPTSVNRPEILGNDVFSSMLMQLYQNDGANNAFPSAHMYLTTLLTLFWSQWYKRYRWVWCMIFAVILLSTLFTQQHYIVDVIGGISLALGSYLFVGYFDQKDIAGWLADSFRRNELTMK